MSDDLLDSLLTGIGDYDLPSPTPATPAAEPATTRAATQRALADAVRKRRERASAGAAAPRNGKAAQLEVIRAAAAVLLEPGSVVEMRVPKTRQKTIAGYFDDPEALARAALDVDGKGPGVYVTLNPVDPKLLARAANHTKPYADTLTKDEEISRRRWLPIDLDPVRPKDISSTAEEHEAAIQRARDVRASLIARGWPEPVAGDSGNGAHLLFPIDLPNDDASRDLVKGFLEALALMFGDDLVAVDVSVFNASRIWKLPGTTACKGDDVPDRPHRQAKLLHVPGELVAVTREQLEALALSVPKPPPRATRPAGGDAFDLDAFISRHGLELRGPSDWQAGRRWIFERCPWNPEHTDRSAYLLQFPSGAIAAGCLHASCTGHDWRELREMYEPATAREHHSAPAPEAKRSSRRPPTASATPALQEAPAAGVEAEEQVDYALSDDGNALRFVADHADRVRFDHTSRRWLLWDGRRWAPDDTERVVELARETARTITLEAATLAGSTNPQDVKRADALLKHAIKSQAANRISGCLELARDDREFVVKADALDTDSFALNCRNGTVDLRTGELRPHRREDLFTHLVDVEYDPEARCKRFEQFLLEVFVNEDGAPDVELVDYVNKAFGYSLTGETSEQCFFLCYGKGANGKSTLLEIIRHLLGSLAHAAAFETLLRQRNDSVNSDDVAQMRGKRFVTAIEADAGRSLNESKIKSLTGGDTIRAKLLYVNSSELRPEFKLWLAANHRPRIRGTDEAIWRRVHLIPFLASFPEDRRDPGLPAKLRAELPGILRWAVQGARNWTREGLKAPPAVRGATGDYRAESDTLGVRLKERPEGFVQTTFGHEKARGWRGIGLRSEHQIFGQRNEAD